MLGINYLRLIALDERIFIILDLPHLGFGHFSGQFLNINSAWTKIKLIANLSVFQIILK